jgi:hypothetical protein
MPAKKNETTALISAGAKLGEPVPRAIIDTNAGAVGIPPQPEFDAEEEIGALRKQLDALRKQVADASRKVKGGARQAARQTEATVKLYPVASLVSVAVLVCAVAFAMTGLRTPPPRSRYERMLDDLSTLYGRVRHHSG